ncbi:MAG: hypothetical protein ACRD9Q_08210 [Nitrososphaeraceae archaeon]
MNKLVLSLTFAFSLAVPLGYAVPAFAITLTQISTDFPSPIGIDHHEEGAVDRVVMSVYYSTGIPDNFVLVASDGTQTPFTTVSGFTDEVKIATARTGSVFPAGTMFTGNGNDGEIVKISPDGTTVLDPWVTLSGAGNGLIRGSLYVDRTGVYGGDLIVVTTAGEVWRINSAGTPTFIADVDVHLEGVVTVPSDASYGPLSGKIIAGAEVPGLLYAFDSAGLDATYDVDVNIEDIDHITGTENFYGVNYGTSNLLGSPASDFAPYAGEILLTEEFHSGSGLYHLFWDGSSLQAPEIPVEPPLPSLGVGQWEHVTFSSAGIVEIPPTDEVIGGEIIPINAAALLIAGAQST